jgi:hypothetical protein
MVRRQPDKRTEAQVVRELGLMVGQTVLCPDGVDRRIRKINSNGEVFVDGLRSKINVYALKKPSN